MSNPPWQPDFLEEYFKMLKHLNLPFVLILKWKSERRDYLNKVFGYRFIYDVVK